MIKYLKQILRISLAIAKAEIKLKHEGSYLGAIWYLLSPLLMFFLLFAVFSPRLGGSIQFYPLYLLLGIIMFNFFQQTTQESTQAIASKARVIKSIPIPSESLVVAIILKGLFSHTLEMVLFAALMGLLQIPMAGLLFYPLILFFFCLFCIGISLILSSLSIYFTDLVNIWSFLVRLIWFATPIFYAIDGQTRLFLINLFNPVYYFIAITRDLMIYDRTPKLWLIGGTAFYSVFFLVVGLIVFHKLKGRFTEYI